MAPLWRDHLNLICVFRDRVTVAPHGVEDRCLAFYIRLMLNLPIAESTYLPGGINHVIEETISNLYFLGINANKAIARHLPNPVQHAEIKH